MTRRSQRLLLAAFLLTAPLIVVGLFLARPTPVHGTAEEKTFLPLIVRQVPLETLAFNSDRSGNDDIYVMQSDGSGQTQLTFDPADDYGAAWSPDGTRIAFTSKRNGKAAIFVMNADGSNQVALTDNASSNSWPDWSPDGSHIVFRSSRDGNNELYVMAANGSNQTRLTYTAVGEGSPQFSPDGAHIVYDIVTTEFFSITQGEIYVMAADGSNQTRLTFDSHNDFYARWSPDGNQIAFFSQRAPVGIFVMDANGANVTPLRAGDEPDWSPDGTRLAYFCSPGGICLMPADGSSEVHITAPGTWNYWPRWKP